MTVARQSVSVHHRHRPDGKALRRRCWLAVVALTALAACGPPAPGPRLDLPTVAPTASLAPLRVALAGTSAVVVTAVTAEPLPTPGGPRLCPVPRRSYTFRRPVEGPGILLAVLGYLNAGGPPEALVPALNELGLVTRVRVWDRDRDGLAEVFVRVEYPGDQSTGTMVWTFRCVGEAYEVEE